MMMWKKWEKVIVKSFIDSRRTNLNIIANQKIIITLNDNKHEKQWW